jgi:hypothetical protein
MQPARRAEEELDTSFAAFTMLAVEIRPQYDHTDFRKNPLADVAGQRAGRVG